MAETDSVRAALAELALEEELKAAEDERARREAQSRSVIVLQAQHQALLRAEQQRARAHVAVPVVEETDDDEKELRAGMARIDELRAERAAALHAERSVPVEIEPTPSFAARHAAIHEEAQEAERQLAIDKARLAAVQKALAAQKATRTIDICFVLDVTSSMAEWIEAAHKQMEEIIGTVQKEFADHSLRTALVGYRDFHDIPPRVIVPFTDDPRAVSRELADVAARGGGDDAEDLIGALDDMMEQDWKARNKIVVVIADAPCHGQIFHPKHRKITDLYPDGHPSLDARDLISAIGRRGIDFSFIRIQPDTDTMMELFTEYYTSASRGRPLLQIPLGSDVSRLLPTVVSSVTASVRFNARH